MHPCSLLLRPYWSENFQNCEKAKVIRGLRPSPGQAAAKRSVPEFLIDRMGCTFNAPLDNLLIETLDDLGGRGSGAVADERGSSSVIICFQPS